MNEAELMVTLQGYLSLTNRLFFGYVNLLPGFLVMSYLVADKISSFLAAISTVLFSIVSALLLLGIFLSRNNAEHLITFMRTQAQRGELNLDWLGFNPTWAADVMSILYIIATFGGYLASVAYFFYKRKHGNMETWKICPAQQFQHCQLVRGKSFVPYHSPPIDLIQTEVGFVEHILKIR